jgi:hypothetical protein
MDTDSISSAVAQSLPLRDESNISDCLCEIEAALDSYAHLKAASQRQMSSKLRRKMLEEGRGILAKLEDWIVRSENTITRDYVLSAMRWEADQRRRSDMLVRVWREQLANVRRWQARLDRALVFVQSDRGQPEDFSLKLLVMDLAKIWDRYTASPFSRSRKGAMPPADFVARICRLVEPNITDARIQTAIRHAVKKIPGERRGRNSRRGKRD